MFPIGTAVVTCEATDDHGNTSVATFTITIRDVVAPVLELVGEPVAHVLDEQGEPVSFDVRAVDAVDGVLEAICDPASGSLFEPGEHPVHCTATDAHGNEGVLDFTLTVDLIDQIAPVIETPGDLVREAVSGEGAPVDFVVSAIDDVDGVVEVTCAPASGSTFPLGSTIVLCNATDAAGNQAQETFLVTVIDTIAPALLVPAPIAIDSFEPAGVPVNYDAIASDLVDGAVDVSCSPASGSVFPLGTSYVMCEATDRHGNTSAGTFTVTVRDAAPPILELDGETTATVSNEAGEAVDFEFAVRAVDAVDGPLDATCDPASGSMFTPGEHPVHCTATDAAGNVGVLDFMLTVVLIDAHTTAQDRINAAFPAIFAEGYSSNLPMGVVVGTPTADRIVMDIASGSGGTRRVWAEGLFGYDDGGTTRPIDTALGQVTGGFSPASVPYDVTLPARFGDGVRWALQDGRGDVVVTPVGANLNAPAGKVTQDPDHVLYPLGWPRIDVVATASGTGVHEHFVARSTEASRVLAWNVTHPAGSELRVEQGQVVIEFADGEVQVLSLTPFARDAAGQLIPARYEVTGVPEGTRLELHWDTTPSTMGGVLQQPVTWPVDVDPQYEIPWAGACAAGQILGQGCDAASFVAQDESDGANIRATCGGSELDVVFEGDGFNRHRDWEYGECKIAGPVEDAAEWVEFRGMFHWGISPDQSVFLIDEDEAAPTASNGAILDDHTPTDDGFAASGDSTVVWNEASDGPPFGAVLLKLKQNVGATPVVGQHNQAVLRNVVRVFADDVAPEAVSFAPDFGDNPDPLVSAGVRTVSVDAVDRGFGCQGGGGHVVIKHNGVTVPGTPWPLVNCQFASAHDFGPGDWDIEFYVGDGLGNGLEVLDGTMTEAASTSFTVADPIVSPENDDPAGLAAFDTTVQVAQDLAPGSAQLWGTNQAGVTFPIGSPVGPGEHEIVWDTTRVQNGQVTLELIYTPNVGAAVTLESVQVEIVNARPMTTATPANAAQTPVGAGLSVLLANGAVSGTYVDVEQRGAGGVTFGLERSYNSQNLAGGVLGAGWRMSFEQRVVVGDDHVVTYVDATGREWPYTPEAGGGYGVAPGQVGQLRLNPDPMTMVNEPWQITYPTGRTLTFAPNGQLVRESWPTGTAIHYAGPFSIGGGETEVRISDDASHQITVRIGVNARVTSVTDSIGRITTYTYDANLRLQTVANADGDVAQTFTYKDYPADSQRPGAILTKVVTPHGDIEFATTDRATEFDEGLQQVEVVKDPSDLPRTFDFDAPEGVTTTFAGRTETSVLDDLGQLESHTNAAGQTTETVYNERGQVEETTQLVLISGDPSPVAIVLNAAEYDDSGVLLSETDAEENTIVYDDHDAFGNPGTIIDEAGELTTYTYDALGRKKSETPAEGGTTNWTYEGLSPLPATVDPPLGATIEYDYSSTGQVEDKFWTDGDNVVHHIERATYDAAGQLKSTRHGDTAPASYEYDGSGRQTKMIDPLGYESFTEYTEDGLVERTIDANGNIRSTTFDAHGRQSVATDPLQFTAVTAYDEFGNVERTTNERNHVTRFEYDAADNLRRQFDPLDRVTRYGYDEFGNQTSETDGENHTITYSIDGNGNETGSLHPGGYTTSTTLTALQNAHVETDERGYSTVYGYDRVGRETSITNAENETTQTGYDAAGRTEWTENAADERTTYTLDPLGRIVRTDVGGTHTTSTWDDAGNERTRTDERNLTTTLSYDAMGRVLSELRPDGSSWAYTYDGNGNRLTEENAEGETTVHTYDELDRRESTTRPDGTTSSYEYDAAGNLNAMQVTGAGRTEYEYDDANQRTKMISPTGDITTYTYDKRGLLKLETNDAKTTEYFYDARGNMTRVERGTSVSTYTHDGTGNVLVHTLPDGSTITYTYDKIGRKTGEVHSMRGETTWTYDPASRIKTEVTSAGTTLYQYDERGRVETITYPGGLVAAFEYDDAGNLMNVLDWSGVRTFTRDAGGRVESFTTVQGKSGTRSYDTAGRLTGQTYLNLRNQPVSQAWVYNSLGQLTSFNTGRGTITYEYEPGTDNLITKTTTDGAQESFTYDVAGRLKTQAVAGQPTLQYSYDSAGRVELIEERPFGALNWVPLHRYTYNTNGQVATWWFKNDWYRTSYTYTAKGNLEAMYRTLGAAPADVAMPSETSTIATCINNPDGFLTCPSTPLNDIVSLSYAVITNPADPTTFTGNKASVAKYLTEHPMRIRFFVHDSQDRLSQQRIWNHTFAQSGRIWTYDSRGNQVPTAAGTGQTYDYANRPLVTTGSLVVTNTWTHDGKLAKAVTTGSFPSVKLYDYDPDGNLIGIGEGTATSTGVNVTTAYDLAWDTRGFASIMSSAWYQPHYPVYNHRGDAIGYHYRNGPSTSGFPLVHHQVTYSPWGESGNFAANNVLLDNHPNYGAQHGAHTINSGLWMGARIHDGIQGRFRQVDPLPGQDGLVDTAYSYASNDPVNNIDPDGLLSRAAAKSQYDGFSRSSGPYGNTWKYYDGCTKAPDSPVTKFTTFIPACNYHDMCLDNSNVWYGSSKIGKCHKNFKQGIRVMCVPLYIQGASGGGADYKLCLKFSNAYFAVVKGHCGECYLNEGRTTSVTRNPCSGGTKPCVTAGDEKLRKQRARGDNYQASWGKCTYICYKP